MTHLTCTATERALQLLSGATVIIRRELVSDPSNYELRIVLTKLLLATAKRVHLDQARGDGKIRVSLLSTATY